MNVNEMLSRFSFDLAEQPDGYQQLLGIFDTMADWLDANNFQRHHIARQPRLCGLVVGACLFYKHYYGNRSSDEYRVLRKLQQLLTPEMVCVAASATVAVKAVYVWMEDMLYTQWATDAAAVPA